MRVLVINGSPKVDKSNTMRLTRAFLDGLKSKVTCDINVFDVYAGKSIHPCCGCYTCWTKTPGECIFDDDMPLEEYLAADLVIWSFPLYYYSMPSMVKGVMDRLLPMVQPLMEVDSAGGAHHPSRYDLAGKKYMLISTCGFYQTENNYDALLRQFELVYSDGYESIICPEGELFRVDNVQDRCDEYLECVTKAGQEYATDNIISPETKSLLAEKLFSPEVFMQMANEDWDIEGDDVQGSKVLRMLRQMAAVYNNQFYKKDTVIEFAFSDTAEVYQLWIDSEKCIAVSDDFKEYTTRIETTSKVWSDISASKINGAQAMMDGLYSVKGDFDTMQDMANMFSTKRGITPEKTKARKTDMKVLLVPFLAFWIGMPMSSFWGGVAVLMVCFAIVLISPRIRVTIYDYLSVGFSMILAICCMNWDIVDVMMPLSYVIYGLMWGISGLLQIPVTAYYSAYSMPDPDSAFDNPLFIKTNRILTVVWAGAYLVAAVAISFIIQSSWGELSGIALWPLFTLMGFFTKWFSKYYPERIAAGK